MRKNLLTILLITCSIPFCFAQTPKKNLEKYWSYRERFLKGFVRIGDNKGESIPAAGRVPHGNCGTDWFIKQDKCTYRKGKGKMVWGDSTIELGNYISVLAMMIRNLKDAKQPYTEEAEELYYAIKAFERLDYNAETFFDKAPKIDGFFIRDDVPADFIYMNRSKKKNFKLKGEDGYSCLMSHGSCKLDNVMDGGVASMDQISNMFLGFSFVCSMIPEVKHGDVLLSDIAALQLHRVTSFLSKNNWKIVAPNGEIPTNAWGGNTISLCYPFAAAAERFTKGKYQKSYQTGRSKRRGKMIYNTFNWAHGIQAERNLWMAYIGAIVSGDWNAKKITKRAVKSNRQMYALAYCAINNQSLSRLIDRKELDKILNSAPIDGPCVDTPGCNAPNGWKSSDRWIHTTNVNGNPYGIQREYNGLDYMLIYNLYHYFYKDTLPRYMK